MRLDCLELPQPTVQERSLRTVTEEPMLLMCSGVVGMGSETYAAHLIREEYHDTTKTVAECGFLGRIVVLCLVLSSTALCFSAIRHAS